MASLTCAALSTSILTARTESQTTATYIINRWAKAIGGIDRLQQVQTIYIRSKLELLGHNGMAEEWFTSKGEHRQEVRLEDLGNFLTVGDGTNFWFRYPNGKVEDILSPFLEDEVRGDYMNTYSHLVPGRMAGRIEYVGLDPTKAFHILKLLPERGRAISCYVNRSSFLPDKCEWSNINGNLMTARYTDWRVVDGIKLPFHISETGADKSDHDVISIEQVKFNMTIPKGTFERPN